VQGSRPAVGPNGEVYVVWSSIGSVDVDYMKIVRSTNQGQAGTFTAPVNVATQFSNYGSGAPGFNRGMGITFPASRWIARPGRTRPRLRHLERVHRLLRRRPGAGGSRRER
jgi:hypothetical protein